jgi:hypothetical protein
MHKLGVFGRVRLYREQLEAAAITRTEATPSAFRYETEGEAENDESLKLYDEE